MDFTLTDEQQALQGLAAQILTDKGTLLRLKELDASDDWSDRDTWAEFATANLLGVAVPEAQGGLGFGFLELCLVLAEQGRRVVPMPLWATLAAGALPISQFGTDAQRAAHLPGVVAGTTVLTGAFEEFGADPEVPATTATRSGDGWTISGVKATVPAAHLATAMLVPATTPEGIGVFIVDPRAAGVTLGRQDTMSHEPRFEVTLTEVRPDGAEMYVQSGWLRASHRKLDRRTSTVTDPRQTHREADAQALRPGQPTRMRVALFPVAHVFRKGSQIRISVQAPGGNRPLWTFETIRNTEPVRNTVVTGGPRASRLVLSRVKVPKGLPTEYPACPSLRGQACRTYVAPAPQTPGPAPR